MQLAAESHSALFIGAIQASQDDSQNVDQNAGQNTGQNTSQIISQNTSCQFLLKHLPSLYTAGYDRAILAAVWE